jgi:DNA-binding beta-propeller fold protein YncE
MAPGRGLLPSLGAAAILAAVGCGAMSSPAASAPPACDPAGSAAEAPRRTVTPSDEVTVRGGEMLRLVEDIPLPGPAARFDYQSVDTAGGRLYIAHMNAGTLLVFDTRERRVVADLPGFASVHGVWAVPELVKVFAAVTGRKEVAVVDAATLEVRARLGPIGYPDGIAYAPDSKRIFVSDESRAGRELVIDAATNRVVGSIELGGEAGNTLYDPGSHCILVAVQTRNEVVAINPLTDSIIGRYPLSGARHPHGLSIDPARRLLFVANEGNATILVVDLATMQVLATHRVGEAPDVLAIDPGLARLYVASESGTVSVFGIRDRGLVPLGELRIPGAHTVAVDPSTHFVYFPLESVGGKPILRIMQP